MGNIINSLLGSSGAGAYDQLSKYINEGMGQRKQYEGSAESALSPYMGNPRLQNKYENAIGGGEDFQGVLDKIMGGYNQSPYAKYLTEQGMNAIQNNASATGMHGSGAENMEFQKNAQNIASGDMNQYLANALGLRSDYLNRLGGIAGTEGERQYGARTNVGNWRNTLGGNLAEDYQKMGGARAAQQQEQDKGRNDILSSLVGGAASIFGGPIGGIAANIGKSLTDKFGGYGKF